MKRVYFMKKKTGLTRHEFVAIFSKQTKKSVENLIIISLYPLRTQGPAF